MADPIYYPSFKPPFLSREKALLQNSLLLRSCPWRIPLGSGELSLTPLTDAPDFSPACVLSIEIDRTTWQVELDDTAMLLRHDIFAEKNGQAPVFDERALPEKVRRALLESLVAPVVTALRSSLGTALSIKDTTFHSAPVHTAFASGFKAMLSACNGLPELTFFLRLSPLREEDAGLLTSALNRLPVSHDGSLKEPVKTVPLEVTLESGYLLLSPDEVAMLAPEDVLLPESWTAPEKLTLRIRRGAAACLTAPCSVSGDQVTIVSPLSEEPEPPMDTAEINDIDIRLSFELDRRIITVGELEALTPGYTFALNCDETSPVTIRANGKAIARGRLVDMDGTLGVQIAETL